MPHAHHHHTYYMSYIVVISKWAWCNSGSTLSNRKPTHCCSSVLVTTGSTEIQVRGLASTFLLPSPTHTCTQSYIMTLSFLSTSFYFTFFHSPSTMCCAVFESPCASSLYSIKPFGFAPSPVPLWAGDCRVLVLLARPGRRVVTTSWRC